MSRTFRLFFLLLSLTGVSALGRALTPAPWLELSLENFAGWSGLQRTDKGAILTTSGKAEFRVPDGSRGWHRPTDYQVENDGVIDARPWYGLHFEIELERDDATFNVDLTVGIPSGQERHNLLDQSSAHLQLRGRGWHAVTVPWESFDYNRGQVQFLKFLKFLSLQGAYQDAGVSTFTLRKVGLVRGNPLSLTCDVRSRPADADGHVVYAVTVTNCAEQPQLVSAMLLRSGWEGMPAEVSPKVLRLAAGASAEVTVSVSVPSNLPPGAHETQALIVAPQDGTGTPAKMDLITVRRLPFPFLVRDAHGWAEVIANTSKYSWAQQAAVETIKKADAWRVPQPFPDNRAPDGTRSVFKSYIENEFAPCTLAYHLTGDKKYAEKIALFLRRLSDPQSGYPRTRHANSNSIPQEGGFFRGCVEGYEAIYDAGVLSDADKNQIEQTFRLYIGVVEDGLGDGGISNWSVFNLVPASLCALAIHDLAEFNQLMDGPCGIVDHVRFGVMTDGWWYEMSLSYNLGCAEEFTRLGLAAQAFGIDFLNRKFPVALTSRVGLRPFEFESFLGMAFGKYGPILRNTVSIKQLWDGIAIYPDYRGVMFGMGDGHEHHLSGTPFELAYRAFRDPAYATIIKQGGRRDLTNAVAELPADSPRLYAVSGHSDNAGIAVLRSQTVGREPREQIQVGFKFGTHGSFHGHFDRLSLLSLMRYGRSFYNPETSWYGYGNYMYKWWVQPSLAHNMVVVDGKQQEPQPSRPLHFYSGAMMQAVAAENTSRWSNPPYFGGYNQLEKVRAGDAGFVAIPEPHPKPGDVTDYTEPVRQRRLLIVTDDYVVVADDLHGEREHVFDQLLHLRGAEIVHPEKLRVLRRDAQFDPHPLGSGQFLTHVTRYAGDTPVSVHSVHRIGDGKKEETGGAKSLSEPGELQIDVHALWPKKIEIATAEYPENWNVERKLSYRVSGDERTLASGVLGTWILGSGAIDVDVTGVKTLRLSADSKRSPSSRKTLFWGAPAIVTAGGKTVALDQLKTTSKNLIPSPRPGRDYEGGPIRIAGIDYDAALGAEPVEDGTAAVINVDLTGLQAVRFHATVGGDWPVGDEEQLRKTVALRTRGTAAQFLTVIEPFENKSLISAATATGPTSLRVELKDGRVQDIVIHSLDTAEGDVSVEIKETKNGKTLRTESSRPGLR